VDNPKLRRFLEAATPNWRLFTTDFTRNFWLLTPQEGTRIEVALDRGKIVAGERQETDLRGRTRIARGRGRRPVYCRTVALQSDLPLHPEGASKAERGYRLASAEALVPVKATDVRRWKWA
jgi:triphosphatase